MTGGPGASGVAAEPEGAHRTLVEALGDAQALTELSPQGYLDGAAWARALERVRLAQHASLPPDEGFRQVGLRLGRAFLATPTGQLVDQTLPGLAPGRVWERLVPQLALRLRPGNLGWEYVPVPGGGQLIIRGGRVASPYVTLGLFQAIAERLTPRSELSLERHDERELVLRVTDLPLPATPGRGSG